MDTNAGNDVYSLSRFRGISDCVSDIVKRDDDLQQALDGTEAAVTTETARDGH